MTLLEAFITDIGFTLFFLIYAFIFNWTYNAIFPMPTGKEVTIENNAI